MADVITFKGVSIFNSSGWGRGYNFVPGVPTQDAIEEASPLGSGFWIKPTGWRPGDHQLSAAWALGTPRELEDMLRGVGGASLGTLVVPTHGTYTRCRLMASSLEAPIKGGGGLYLVRGVLVFREYP